MPHSGAGSRARRVACYFELPRIPIPRTRLHKDLAHGAPQPPRLLYVSSFVRRGSAFHEGLVLVGCHSPTPTTCRCLRCVGQPRAPALA